MCIGYPARVLAVTGSAVVVGDAGRPRHVMAIDLPELRSGDWVLVAAGSAVRRLSPEEAEQLEAIYAIAPPERSTRTGA